MKTKNILSLLALSATMTFFAACSEENEPYADPDKVIESEVVDPGVAEEVTEVNNGTEGTSLSYESWIVVHQVFADGSTSKPQGGTRAARSSSGCNKISVLLSNTIANSSSTLEVSDFTLNAEGVPGVDYRELGSNRHETQSFVTVVDSAMVYTVDRGLFAVEFVLPYQVAVYNDGITKVTMPYHKYSELRDNGGNLSDLDNAEVNGKVYQRKLYKHEISVAFNGKEYAVSAEIVLMKEQQEDYLVSQKVVDSGVELVSYDINARTGVSKSWIKLEENWSVSGVKTVTKEILLKNSDSESSYRGFYLETPNKVSFTSLVVGEISESETLEGSRADGEMTVSQYSRLYQLPVRDEAGISSSYLFGVVYETAVYSKDGFSYEMPSLRYSAVNISMSLGKDWYTRDDGREVMDVVFNASVSFDKAVYDYSGTGQVVYLNKK